MCVPGILYLFFQRKGLSGRQWNGRQQTELSISAVVLFINSRRVVLLFYFGRQLRDGFWVRCESVCVISSYISVACFIQHVFHTFWKDDTVQYCSYLCISHNTTKNQNKTLCSSTATQCEHRKNQKPPKTFTTLCYAASFHSTPNQPQSLFFPTLLSTSYTWSCKINLKFKYTYFT